MAVPPLRVMASNGDGTFRDATADLITRAPGAFLNPALPIQGVTADFNNDGRPDVAVFDYGTECGQLPSGHTFNGYPPVLLLSGPSGRWTASSALADAITTHHATRLTRYSGPNLRALGASAGDVNADGRVDLWVESCGGENVCSHFLMNNGDGTFTVDVDRVPYEVLHNPPPEFWRHQANALVDLNGDGMLDLVLGQGKTSDPTHINESSLVVFNNGAGRFPLSNRVRLPAPAYANGFTAVGSLAVVDIDRDGRKDLIFAHRPNNFPDYFGRYIQIIMNRGGGQFVDETNVRMGDQSATAPQRSSVYAQDLNNQVYAVFLTDVNNDGAVDIALNSMFYLGTDTPFVHLNNGSGRFTVADPGIFTGGDLYFGENSVPLDLNGDAIVDVAHTDNVPGADGTFGNADDATRFIALVGAGIPKGPPAPPNDITVSSSGSTATFSWSAPFSGPVPIGYVFEAGSGRGLADFATLARGPATSLPVSGLAAGAYFVRVRTVTTHGTSGPSPEAVLTIGGGCSPPIPPAVSSRVSGSTVTLFWTTSPGATSYVLEAGSAPGSTDIVTSDTGGVGTTFVANGVPAGTYFVRIRARSACGTSAPSNELTVVVAG
jgi:hypothetical protein